MSAPDACPLCGNPIAPDAELPADRILENILAGSGRPSPLLYDREVARFLIAGVGTMPDNLLLADCVARFGKDRSPSASAMNRLAVRVRTIRRTARGLGAKR